MNREKILNDKELTDKELNERMNSLKSGRFTLNEDTQKWKEISQQPASKFDDSY